MRTLVVALLLLLPLAAAADARASKAPRHSKATVAACDPAADTAVFRGTITAFGKATSLQLRFTLQARPLSGGRFRHVDASSFDAWLTASAGNGRSG